MRPDNFVRHLSLRFVMRLAIEPAASSMAAEIKADTTEIESALHLMKQANDGIGDPLQADSAFHAAVLRVSGNRFFAQMAPLVDTALRMSIRLTNKVKRVRMANVEDHESILIAIQRNRKQRAFRETKALIEEALTLVQTQLQAPSETVNRIAAQPHGNALNTPRSFDPVPSFDKEVLSAKSVARLNLRVSR